MRNYRSVLWILLGMLIMHGTGCENDILDTYPRDELSSETFWESEEDAISAVSSVYNTLPDIGSEITLDNLSDIAHTTNPANFRQTIEKGEHDSNVDYFANLWDSHYVSIRRVNYFLENVDRIFEHESNVSEDLITRLKAEVRVIRAMQYMRLSFFFGNVPLITSTLSPEEGAEVEQALREEVVDFIDRELTEAAEDLPLEYHSSENIGRITRGAALALKTRAMLYNSRWEEAANSAQKVMDFGIYSLYDNFENLFSYEAQNNSEIILDRQYTRDDLEHAFFGYAPHGMNGSSGISVTRTLVDAFETANGLSIEEDPAYNQTDPYSNRDPRLDYTLFLPAFSDDIPGEIMYNGVEYDPRPGSGTADEVERDLGRTKTGFNTQKYINEEDLDDRSNNGINFILIRYADVLLMYAEAKIEMNEIDESVYEAINKVRQRPDVDMPPITTGKSQQEMREIVRQERMVELALEGLRFWDIRRWRIAEDVMQGIIPGMRYIEVDGRSDEIQTYIFGGTTRSFDPERDYLFPIPNQELILNSNLVQNPGY